MSEDNCPLIAGSVLQKNECLYLQSIFNQAGRECQRGTMGECVLSGSLKKINKQNSVQTILIASKITHNSLKKRRKVVIKEECPTKLN